MATQSKPVATQSKPVATQSNHSQINGDTANSMATQPNQWLHSQTNGYTVKPMAIQSNQWLYNQINGAITSDTTDISFIKIFNDGPDVSLNGSPTVSPTTAALCISDPLPY